MRAYLHTLPPVKATRHTPRPATRFGSAILPNPPVYRAPATLEDMAWAAREFNAEVTAADREFDRLAGVAVVMDRYERGLML